MSIWVFPGQGAQRPHMAAGCGEAPALLRTARDILGTDLTGCCLTDPEPAWDPATVQPALFVVGVATARALLRHGPPPEGVIGHSFGEFAALTAVGSLSFETGLVLTAQRARAMADAATTDTGMMAVLGLTADQVRAVCGSIARRGTAIAVSNVNSPTQTVLAGENAAMQEAARRCRARGAHRTRVLRVPYAAHTPLMEPASDTLRRALKDIELRPPAAPLYSCVTGTATTDPGRIKELLVTGMSRTVDFRAAVESAAADGHRAFTELGPGSPARLLGLIRETLPQHRLDLRLVSGDEEARTPRPFQPERQDRAAPRPAGTEDRHGG
ncbi:ACP S-malonyltransferase [Streptomyces orinoci]|uniref:Malonyl CoA-acyl carrier protein transacylase n=1 Tax=Streptomyces orinoci TaxID=67339 RepID=A0ABV3JQQ0_STRON|nr:ACP S-malonyltransferase [Streptomyces orinoci]